jgi:hypothetical protein
MQGPDPNLPDPERSRAVIIAVGELTGSDLAQYPQLAAGAYEFARLLRSEAIWGLPESHCKVLTGAESTDRGSVLGAVNAAAQEAEDAVLVYFAGHGMSTERGFYMALSRARNADREGWLSWLDLRERLDDSLTRAQQRIVVIDACQSAEAITQGPTQGNSALLASCSATERAWIARDGEYPQYTAALIEELSSGADTGEARSPFAIHQAVQRRLGEPNQHPRFLAANDGGTRPWLRNGIPPGPLPARSSDQEPGRTGNGHRSIGAFQRPRPKWIVPSAVLVVIVFAAVLFALNLDPAGSDHGGGGNAGDDIESISSTPEVQPIDGPNALEAAKERCAPSSEGVRVVDDGFTLIIERAIRGRPEHRWRRAKLRVRPTRYARIGPRAHLADEWLQRRSGGRLLQFRCFLVV